MTSDQMLVAPGDHGLSLLQFLKGKLSYSGKAIKRAIDANGCFINGRVERFSSFRVKQGDMVAIAVEKGRKKSQTPFPVLYEDDSLRAVNKSPFISCNKTHTLHRLDKETSGVLLTSDDQAYFDLFRNRQMNKVYIAVVEGKSEKKSGEINLPIGVKKRYEGHKVMHVDPNGKEAITRYQVIKTGKDFSVLMLFPKTGRTHQIRVHLNSIGLSILGDYDYGQAFSLVAPRMLLHAFEINFVHPHKKKKMCICAPLPEDMFAYIKESEIKASACFFLNGFESEIATFFSP